MESLFTEYLIFKVLFTAMIAILFLQSGFDKVFNYKDELGFYKSHFSKTFLKPVVPLLMIVITIVETLAGIVSTIGLVMLMMQGNPWLAQVGSLLACLAVIFLFLGQRIAKDYGGAATLVPYFLLCVAALYVNML